MTAAAFSPEVVAGARAMFNHWSGFHKGWETLSDGMQEEYCQAFSAGVQALLPVREEVCEAATQGYEPEEFAKEFTAAINHITSGTHVTHHPLPSIHAKA